MALSIEQKQAVLDKHDLTKCSSYDIANIVMELSGWEDPRTFPYLEVANMVKVYAQTHVQQALKSALEQARIAQIFNAENESWSLVISKDSILKSYPKKNIR